MPKRAIREWWRALREEDRRFWYWFVLGAVIALFVRALGVNWVGAVYRGFALALGAGLVDYGYFAGVVRKNIQKSGYSKLPRYRGRAAVIFGVVNIIFGLLLIVAGMVLRP